MSCPIFFYEAEKLINTLMDICDEKFLHWEGHEKALNIKMPDEKIYAIHRHDTLEEIWLSSPHSGGHHYKWAQDKKNWFCRRNNSFFPNFLFEEWAQYYLLKV